MYHSSLALKRSASAYLFTLNSALTANTSLLYLLLLIKSFIHFRVFGYSVSTSGRPQSTADGDVTVTLAIVRPLFGCSSWLHRWHWALHSFRSGLRHHRVVLRPSRSKWYNSLVTGSTSWTLNPHSVTTISGAKNSGPLKKFQWYYDRIWNQFKKINLWSRILRLEYKIYKNNFYLETNFNYNITLGLKLDRIFSRWYENQKNVKNEDSWWNWSIKLIHNRDFQVCQAYFWTRLTRQ